MFWRELSAGIVAQLEEPKKREYQRILSFLFCQKIYLNFFGEQPKFFLKTLLKYCVDEKPHK